MTNNGFNGFPSAAGAQAAADIRYRVDPMATALGYINYNWNGAINGAGTAPSSQRAEVAAIALPPGALVSTVYLNVIVAGTSTAPTGFFVGLCTTTRMLAQSANLASSSSLTATGAKPFALNGSYTTNVNDSPTGLYYVMILQNGAFAGTNVTFHRGNSSIAAYGLNGPLIGNLGSGLTAPPANNSAVSISTGGGSGWVVAVA